MKNNKLDKSPIEWADLRKEDRTFLEEIDALVEQMNTPNAREAARILFSATGDDLGQAAVRVVKEHNEKQEVLKNDKTN